MLHETHIGKYLRIILVSMLLFKSVFCFRLQKFPMKSSNMLQRTMQSCHTPEIVLQPNVVIVLAGATSVGKSAVAMELCKKIGGEIVISDSVQVYTGLNIGSNKPSDADMAAVPHHLINIAEPSEQMLTAGDFCRFAATTISDILSRGRVPVVVGGSTMWVQWLVHGIPDAPKASPEAVARAALLIGKMEQAKQWDEAVEVLKQYDTSRFEKLTRNDWYRLRRFLEIALEHSHDKSGSSSLAADRDKHTDATDRDTAGVGAGAKRPRSDSPVLDGSRTRVLPILQQDSGDAGAAPHSEKEAGDGGGGGGEDSVQAHTETAGVDVRTIFLCEDRTELYHTIDERCVLLLKQGLLSETGTLLASEVLTPEFHVSKAIGYRQSIDYLINGMKDGEPTSREDGTGSSNGCSHEITEKQGSDKKDTSTLHGLREWANKKRQSPPTIQSGADVEVEQFVAFLQ
jgi:tRNA dimethylallyltransferase